MVLSFEFDEKFWFFSMIAIIALSQISSGIRSAVTRFISNRIGKLNLSSRQKVKLGVFLLISAGFYITKSWLFPLALAIWVLIQRRHELLLVRRDS